MCRILPAIDSLDQHLFQLEHHPEAYRPERCPHCGMGDLWRHGYYFRKADREGVDGFYLDPVPIPRYYCGDCTRTCSRLPSIIAPHRWYLWPVQQTVLALLLSGFSVRKVACKCRPGRRTISRWWYWLEQRFDLHSFHLRNRFPELGRYAGLTSFWMACFDRMSLADAMACLDRESVIIP